MAKVFCDYTSVAMMCSPIVAAAKEKTPSFKQLKKARKQKVANESFQSRAFKAMNKR